MFRVVLPLIIRSAYYCIYSIWYLSHRYCYLPLTWKSWNWFECAVGGGSDGTSTHHQERIQLYLQHLVFVTPLLLSAANVEELEPVWVCCGWRKPSSAVGGVHHLKHVEQFPDINKLCNVASCWIYENTGILLGVHCILHISRIRVKADANVWQFKDMYELCAECMPFMSGNCYMYRKGRVRL